MGPCPSRPLDAQIPRSLAGEEASSQLQDASQERWELQLQARLKSEQAEAYEARLRYLQDEVGTKQERLRRVTQEAEHAQAMLRDECAYRSYVACA